MIDMTTLASQLCQNPDGIWVASSQRGISYPEDGNDACFELEDNSFWFRHRNRVIVDLVRSFCPDELFFDIGGGNGCVAKALQDAGFRVALVEPGRGGVRNARLRGLETVVQSTLEDAGFAPESIGAAGIFDVLEHIESDGEFASMLHRYLRPDGYLFVTVPAYPFLWSVDDVHAGHYRRYTFRR